MPPGFFVLSVVRSPVKPGMTNKSYVVPDLKCFHVMPDLK